MKFLLNKSFLFLVLISINLLVTPVVWSASSEEDDDSEEDAVVNDEGQNADAVPAAESTEDDDTLTVVSSPFVTTSLLFTKPETLEFPAGKLVKLVVGFHNNGSASFMVDTIEASLRYPQDFSYYIQNFTAFQYSKIVESEKEATFEYGFTPSETFSSRPFGLVISVNYRDAEGKVYVNGLFNDTINIIEPEEGFDGETFFLYIFLVAIVVLLLVVVQQFFSTSIKKRVMPKSSKVQQQVLSNGKEDIDFEWIPKEHLQTNKSPKTSPRQRKVKTSTSGGSGEEQSE